MEFKNIIYDVKNGIASIILNTPHNVNAINDQMLDDMKAALKLCEEDEDVKVVLIRANGRSFCGGGDIKEMLDGLCQGKVVLEVTAEKGSQLSFQIKNLPKPVIASVFGAIAGAGFPIVLACDFCIASEDAKFIPAFINIGLVPDAGGIYLMEKALGANKAIQLAMTGAPVTAEEGVALGFVYKKCDRDALEEETLVLAQKLAKGPFLAYAKLKKLVLETLYGDFSDYLVKEVKAQVNCSRTEDFKEGIIAFTEKRAARFTGK